MKELLDLFIGGLGFCLLVGGLYYLYQGKDKLLGWFMLLYGVAIVPRMIWPENDIIKAVSLAMRLAGIVLLFKFLRRQQKESKG